MKTNPIFRVVFVALFFTLLLGACSKEDEVKPPSRVVFWSKRSDIKNLKADCYVDGKLTGTLTNATSIEPACGQPGSLSSDVTPGRHTFEFRIVTGQSLKLEMDVPDGECRTVELT